MTDHALPPARRKDGTTTTPRRGYSWPPFEPGNRMTLTHGAYSERSWRPLADRLAAHLVETAPWSGRDTFAPTVAAWARTEAQIQRLMDYLDHHGPLDSEGETRPAATHLARLETTAANLRASLGLDPSSLARLLRDVSAVSEAVLEEVGLEALAAEGRAIRAQAEQRQLQADASAPGSGPDLTQDRRDGPTEPNHLEGGESR